MCLVLNDGWCWFPLDGGKQSKTFNSDTRQEGTITDKEAPRKCVCVCACACVHLLGHGLTHSVGKADGTFLLLLCGIVRRQELKVEAEAAAEGGDQ